MFNIPETKLKNSIRFIRNRTRLRPRYGVVLGSGLGNFSNEIENPVCLSADDIPDYPPVSISGHAGNLHFGNIKKAEVVVFQGRTHFYETGFLEDILYPVSIAARLGVKILILTNAAGGIDPRFKPGDLMLIRDHIDLTFSVIPMPINHRVRCRDYYDGFLINLAHSAAAREQIVIREGVYCGVSGPSYETSAEIKMLRAIGADAVGMSTINEAAYAYNLGMKVIGISCITNAASGLGKDKLNHAEVTSAASMATEPLSRLLRNFITKADRCSGKRQILHISG